MPDTAAAITTRLVTTSSEFESLRLDWANLHRRICGTVFQSFEWQYTWWRHCGETDPHRSLRIIVFSRGGRVVAIAPLMLEREHVLGVIPITTLRFVASGISDYLGVLCEHPEIDDVANALAAELLVLHADIVVLQDLPGGAYFCIRLVSLLRGRGWTVDEIESEHCPRTRLEATWSETLAGLSRTVRKRMTQKQKRLQNDFSVVYSVIQDEREFDEVYSWLLEAHAKQWRARGYGGVFKRENESRFLHEVARLLLPTGWLFLAQLKMNGRRVAVEYGFQVGDSLQVYQGAMDCPEEWKKYSPGTVIHTFGMQAMVARGVRVYDFLQGTEPYKYSLGATDHVTWRARFFRPHTPLSRLKKRLWLLQQTSRQWLARVTVALRARYHPSSALRGAAMQDAE